jgi:hypothetical protein
MVELGHSCVELDSPGVILQQLGDSFVFRASTSNTPLGYFRLTPELRLEVAVDVDLANAPVGPPKTWNDDDPTETFGYLPGLFPISAAAKSLDGRCVYYSVMPGEGWSPFTRVVRYDMQQRRIVAHVDLSKVGCNDDPNEPQYTGRVHYLFVDAQGRLIAVAGSDVHYLDHDHVHW